MVHRTHGDGGSDRPHTATFGMDTICTKGPAASRTAEGSEHEISPAVSRPQTMRVSADVPTSTTARAACTNGPLVKVVVVRVRPSYMNMTPSCCTAVHKIAPNGKLCQTTKEIKIGHTCYPNESIGYHLCDRMRHHADERTELRQYRLQRRAIAGHRSTEWNHPLSKLQVSNDRISDERWITCAPRHCFVPQGGLSKLAS